MVFNIWCGEGEPLLLFCFLKILHLNTILQFTNFYFTTPLRGRYHPSIIEENSQSSVHLITQALPLFSSLENEGKSGMLGLENWSHKSCPQCTVNLQLGQLTSSHIMSLHVQILQNARSILMNYEDQRALLKDRRQTTQSFKMRKEHEHYKSMDITKH